jgi:small subunit ribosomal protein S16
MLTIRLSRIGKKNKPMYRLIISEKGRDPYGHHLEILGSYNPYTKELQAKGERIKYWLSKGAKMSPTVNNLLIAQGIIEGEKVKASSPGKKKENIKTTAKAPQEEKLPEEKKPQEEKAEESTEKASS